MADWTCRRFLRLFGSCAPTSSVLQIFSALVRVKVDHLLFLWRISAATESVNEETRREGKGSTLEAVREDISGMLAHIRAMVGKMKSLYPARSPAGIAEGLATCRHYVMAAEAEVKAQWVRRARLTEQLVQMSSSSSFSGLSIGSDALSLSPWKEGAVGLRMKVLYADVLRKGCRLEESLKLTSEILEKAEEFGLVELQLQVIFKPKNTPVTRSYSPRTGAAHERCSHFADQRCCKRA